MSFQHLGLSSHLLQAISDQGYIKPTPIQERAIPIILSGKDVMGGAQTGTGKTAGFVLPTLQKLEIHANSSTSPAKHPIRALILVPTRELAVQVYDSIKVYGKYLSLRSAVIYGGVGIDSQISALRSGVEILVATPGRLLDHIQQKNIALNKVEVFILDEADRMLDMGFMPDIKQVIQLLPNQRQNLMFSATFSEEIKKLANKILIEPVLVEVAKQNTTNELITHIVYPVESGMKKALLKFLIESRELSQVLVFTKTKRNADLLTKYLNNSGITSLAIHGDRNQLQRMQALNSFKEGQVRVLVATDVAARGIDIDALACVINFELPKNPEDYIHRIGRTGRAGTKGYAISLVSKEDNNELAGIEKLLNTTIHKEKVIGFETDQSVSTQSTSSENQSKNKSSKSTRSIASNAVRAKSDGLSRQDNSRNSMNRERSPRKRPETHTRKNSDDALFTQPYVPKISGTKSTENSESTEKPHKHFNRPIPALLISRGVNKERS
ncbi:ATP-dependent RNA helicase RhlE [Nitrosomonas sp. PY1]|uniref:DEAD/DEAH box helicase n=1 Tax=Nitrosomonas sp. PY1 TaxID=1803906 RepID=UPI001FC8DC48|nr:DEAD/DEAH box helicase [Nitrosomonas sp. PY1]GKS70169.1 ATP-dependent RNA helicase RhlE [Nitrosomonas sp. PY1]